MEMSARSAILVSGLIGPAARSSLDVGADRPKPRKSPLALLSPSDAACCPSGEGLPGARGIE
jgi:hypothetical protein